MTLHVLSVAYPFAPVGRDTAGGAEQVLAAIDADLVRVGWRSTVIAQAGSTTQGRLVPVSVPGGEIDDRVRSAIHARLRATLAEVLASDPVDLVHMHGHDFTAYLPAPGAPVLATLHLPPSWYPPAALKPERPGTWLSAVSESQMRGGPRGIAFAAVITNGVPLDRLAARHARRNFALVLARICPEKGIHLAIDAAESAGVPLLIGGDVFPYPEHMAYFEKRIRPRLGPSCRFLGPLGFARKRRLLSAARCLLVASLVDETSSLVAREAAACGTPVMAFARGALPETVVDGRTGFLVQDVVGMARAVTRAHTIDPQECRAQAATHFDERQMTARYRELYGRLCRQRLSGAA
jgi:glycosyltransferase involved in cell wall biosynthesis